MNEKRGRVGRWLFHQVCALAEAVKDAAEDLRAHSGILLSLLGKAAWLVPLAVMPHLFLTFPTFYAGFADVGPEWAWAIAVFALICFDALALARRAYSLHLTAQIVGMFVWFFLASLAARGGPRGWLGVPGVPSAYIYGFAAIACLVGIIRTAQRHSARVEAENYLAVAREVRREWQADGAE